MPIYAYFHVFSSMPVIYLHKKNCFPKYANVLWLRQMSTNYKWLTVFISNLYHF